MTIWGERSGAAPHIYLIQASRGGKLAFISRHGIKTGNFQAMLRLPGKFGKRISGIITRWQGDRLIRTGLVLARDKPGDYAESGVYKGRTFLMIAKEAQTRSKIAHAFDSFQGMAPPGARDFGPGGECEYPEGRLTTGGSGQLTRQLQSNGVDNYRIHEGFIPQIFQTTNIAKICFAHIDLDHYQPTVDTAKWCMERMVPGGVIVFDDYFPGRTLLATPAIEEFLQFYSGDIEFTRAAGRKLLIAKAF
ncbi:MAG: class I SAM-dependent methyltransferase [Pirellulaceae bacterium]